MRDTQKWLTVSLLACLAVGHVHADESSDSTDKCAVKLSEIDAAIEEARKEGSMRKVAMLKDLRVDALRCANKAKT